MRKLFTIIILSLFAVCVKAQSGNADVSNEYNIDSLREIYGRHKQFLQGYELVSLLALSYYPELINEQIKFKLASINSTARTTVSFFSVFVKNNKHYIIYINDDIKRTGVLLNQTPFDAQVAVIAHELAHVIDFKSRGFLNMSLWGIGYLFAKHRTKIEKKADLVVIKHGLGLELYDWADYILNHSTANKRYLKLKKTKYLLPDEILIYRKKYSK